MEIKSQMKSQFTIYKRNCFTQMKNRLLKSADATVLFYHLNWISLKKSIDNCSVSQARVIVRFVSDHNLINELSVSIPFLLRQYMNDSTIKSSSLSKEMSSNRIS